MKYLVSAHSATVCCTKGFLWTELLCLIFAAPQDIHNIPLLRNISMETYIAGKTQKYLRTYTISFCSGRVQQHCYGNIHLNFAGKTHKNISGHNIPLLRDRTMTLASPQDAHNNLLLNNVFRNILTALKYAIFPNGVNA